MQDPADPESLITIGRYYHPMEAQIAAGRLRAEGIPVLMPEINLASANWLLSTGLGGIRIQVAAKHADTAKEILSEIHEPDESDEMICPNCGSSNTQYAASSWKFAFLSIHFFSLPMPWKNESRNCLECFAEWNPDK